MSHGLTESTTYDATVTVPDDADTANAGSVNVAFQAIANRTKQLRSKIPASAGGNQQLTMAAAKATNWAFDAGDVAGQTDHTWYQSSVASADLLEFQLQHIPGAKFTQIVVTLKGKAGHGGLPGTMPKIQLFKTDRAAHTSAQVGSDQSDTSANVAAYEAVHTVTLTVSEQTMSETAVYYLKITGEDGANEMAGLEYAGGHIVVSVNAA